ncbi:cytochrome c3 family protein [Desulfobulbus elongatus]|uniref:cytochrome c3 family protein n=1 Tax=Desulfobulbus elongatus TaxID=53332 RepID=UPI0009FEEAA3|nr:cytochrome c3 family protein [Desulfobulbus elongatus]
MWHLFVYPFLLVLFFVSGATHVVFAENGKSNGDNRGPDFVIIQSTIDTEKVAKPAYLPHRAHQWLECDGCHHGKGADGKKIKYVAGQNIEKCETCHNSRMTLPEKVATLKRASHRLCLACHRKQGKEYATCEVCHNI